MCHEICLKTYQQALGILPNAEDPECMCYPALPSARDTDMALSCSCSEDKSSVVGSDTDFDEWFVEFTPPNATYDPIYKGKKVLKVDIGSQYSYLDYRVKLVDRFGNPIPRFFKGPDGKQQCSDLGGFWSPEHKWLEINVDGYIALDGKWAPMTFIGPSGEQVEAETGKFQATNGKWLVVGVDGFVDSQGNWKFYPKAKESIKKRYGAPTNKGKGRTDDKTVRKPGYKSDVWSCFGDASPKKLSELGIVGHGGDRKLLLMKLQKILAGGEYVRVPQPPTVDHLPTSKKARKKGKRMFSRSFQEGYKCHHPVPSEKGIIAVDDHGNKTYFKLRNYNNKRPKDRMASLTEQGISLSSFHVPCFHSFINSEVVKQQQRDRILALSKRNVATQLE
ncbi:jg25514 [Pararge aegeria aegeria]|nr:jg25514 [Pararge aegeria aegeria]